MASKHLSTRSGASSTPDLVAYFFKASLESMSSPSISEASRGRRKVSARAVSTTCSVMVVWLVDRWWRTHGREKVPPKKIMSQRRQMDLALSTRIMIDD
jgi:hypothetical protein